MPNPVMDPDPTIAARRRRPALVELSAVTPVRVARAVLAVSGTDAAVVLDEHERVGLVTAAALAGHEPEAPIGEVMNLELVRIDPHADEHDTLVAYQDAAWRSLRRRRPCAEPEDDIPKDR